MMKRVRKLMNKQDGMTLVEVIVALVLFVFVFMILLYGINSALKVMGNANAINNATQSDASKLETLNSSLESSGKATLTPLGNALKITEDGKTYTVAGQFKVATTQKTNDQTDLSLTYFDSKKAAATKPVPTVGPVPTTSGDKAVVVPDPGTDANKDNKYYAYYSPDGDNTIMSGAGVFQTWLFNHNDGGWSAFYYGKYGSLTKGVTTESYLTNENTENPRFEYLQQLYFINNEPFKFQGGGTQSGIYGFYLNFLYVGTTDADTVTHVKFSLQQNDLNTKKYVSALTIRGYDSGKTTIMYLPRPWVLKADPEDITVYDPPYDKPTINSVTLPAGYYEFPADKDVDILKALYDETAKSEILSYKKSYDDVKTRLDELNVTVQ